MAGQYITAKKFDDFKTNQDTLIDVLNHNMTRLSIDVCYIKLYLKWSIGVMTTIGVAGIIALIL